jgi:hypothetical protein
VVRKTKTPPEGGALVLDAYHELPTLGRCFDLPNDLAPHICGQSHDLPPKNPY